MTLQLIEMALVPESVSAYSNNDLMATVDCQVPGNTAHKNTSNKSIL